jgi:hypothetical protein
MLPRSICAGLAGLLLASAPVRAQPVVQEPVEDSDNPALAKIDRTIAKEPRYQGKPKYCLAVFGPKAKTRVLVVIDRDMLYADLNGNGDLTEKGEAFRMVKSDSGQSWNSLKIGDVLDRQTLLTHKEFSVSHWDGDTFRLSVEAAFERVKVPSLDAFANATFGDKPANAPVVHFGGSLRLELSVANIRGRPALLCPEVGTAGIGKGSFAYYTKSVFDTIDPKLVPDLELEYAGEKGAVVREKAKFCRDGFERVYLYPVTPGKKGDPRTVRITLSFEDLWAINIASHSVTRPILTFEK